MLRSLPLKIGIAVVVSAYFFFVFHGTFTLSWIEEWEYFGTGSIWATIIFWEDISAFVGLLFRLAASAIAFTSVILYFVRKTLSEQTIVKILRVVLVGEAIYWIGLLPSGIMPLAYFVDFSGHSPFDVLVRLLTNEVPLLVESVAIPAVLLKLAYELSPKKPLKDAIKWGLTAGTVYVFAFCFTHTGIWISTVRTKGVECLIAYPENLFSFGLTTIGMLALTIFTAHFAKTYIVALTLKDLNLQKIGAIITSLGLFFLCNYLTWILFGRNETWSTWYAWFLGHNMDLWMLSLPLAGLPLILEEVQY